MRGTQPFRGTITDIDLRLLRIFRTIVECGGITPAGIELNVDRSTVSKHLADLETRIGLRLCERGRHGFVLTPEGDRVYRATGNLIGTLSAFSNEIAEIHGNLSGVFDIAIADGALKNPEGRLDRGFALFHKEAPDVHLRINISSANEIERGVTEGRYTAGLVPFHHSIDGLDHEILFTEDARLYCGSGHPFFERCDEEISLSDLAEANYVEWGYFVDEGQYASRIEFTPRATVFNNEGAAMLILGGSFIGFLPTHYAEQWISQGRMRSILHELAYYRKPMALIFKRVFAESSMIRCFSKCLKEEIN